MSGRLYRELVQREVQKKEFRILTVENLKLYGHTYIIYYKQRPLSGNAQLLLKLLRRRKQKQKPWSAVAVLAHVLMSQIFPDGGFLSGLGT